MRVVHYLNATSLWSTGSDLNRRLYDFADRCIGPLCHPYIDLVEHPGIEPGMSKDGGFTVHCITVDASAPLIKLY